MAMQKFPNDPIFTQLANLCRIVPGVLIHDNYGIEAGYLDLMGDVTHLCHILRQGLPREWFDSRGILNSKADPIAAVALSGYYVAVGFLAVLALGGQYMPLPILGPIEEPTYILDKANTVYVLSEPHALDKAAELQAHVQNIEGRRLHTILIQRGELNPSPMMEIAQNINLSESDPALILFTSGSSGHPKGVAIPRRRFFFDSLLESTSFYLSYQPLAWIGGFIPFLSHILQGGKVCSLRRGTGPLRIWNAWKDFPITSMFIPPILFKSMQEYYLSAIRHLPPAEHDQYIRGASQLQKVGIPGSLLNPETAQFWKNLIEMPIVPQYGSTELARCVIEPQKSTDFIDGCIGEPTTDVQVKLSDGEKGELYIKAPGMFTHYIGDEEATKAAFDEDGFFNTGDIAHRVGNRYFFDGRASTDWIRFSFFTISVAEVEKELMNLPYVSEAYVLPVMDYEVRGLAATVVRLCSPHVARGSDLGDKNPEHLKINLGKIRDDLSSTLEVWKLPTLCYILQDGEKVPVSASGKVLKPLMREQFFQVSGYRPADYAVPGVEFWGDSVDLKLLIESQKLCRS